MSMARYKSCDIRKLGSQSHHCVRKVIAARARLQSHVTCEDNRVCAFAVYFRNCSPYRLNRMSKINPDRKLPRKPKRHARRCDSDNSDFDARNLLNEEWLNLCERMLGIGR